MEPLEHPDPLYLSAACGWLELGNCAEAAAELARMTPGTADHPDVLQLRWHIAAKEERWEDALGLAERICEVTPLSPFGWIHRSYCLHELQRTRDAWDALLPMTGKFPNEWLICYNLSCYACQLGRLEEAKSWLGRALTLGDPAEVKKLASQDIDLRPLFPPEP